MFPRLRDLDPNLTRGVFQVLLNALVLRRDSQGTGITLEIDLSGDEEVLLGGADKRAAAEVQDQGVGRRLAEDFDHFRREARPGDALRLTSPHFRPRHASGGALVEIAPEGEPPRVLLAHRDIAPVGWNLVNGASSRRAELGDLEAVIARECAEELLFLDAQHQLRGLALPSKAEEASQARRGWAERLEAEEGPPLRAHWLDGPDCLVVRDRLAQTEIRTTGLHLTLQAEDFGLECLRRLRIDAPALRPIDGELAGDRLLDRRIGLFRPESLDDDFPRPDLSFRGAALVDDDPTLSLPLCPVVRRLWATLSRP